jgi:AcrR family transcriptional regulator
MAPLAPAPATRTARGESTRERILEAARAEIIASQGAMELAAVAKRAGVSPGLPYRYFDSKSALLVAVVESFFDAVDAAVYRPVFEEVSTDWWERENARIAAMVDFFYDEPLGPFIVTQLAGDAAVVEAQHRRLTRQVRGAARNVKTGKKVGCVPARVDEQISGALLMGGVYQAIHFALTSKPRVRKHRLVSELQDFMRHVLQIEE